MENFKFMQYTTDYISGIMSLRKPQEKSLKILEDIMNSTNLIKNPNINHSLEIVKKKYPTCSNFEREFISLTFALATGVGKTRLMGAFITYLYTNYNIKNYLVVAPGTTIYEKLKSDLGNPDNPKYVFKGIGCFNKAPQIIADDDYTDKNFSLFDSDIKIYVYNIGKFDKENVKMKAKNENLGMSFYEKLATMEDLVMIMDESHHYRADKGMKALNELNPLLGLELTATPRVNMGNKQEFFKNVVYEYPLSKAIEDGYTRVPFAITRTDIDFYHFGDEALDKLMLNDGIKCHEKIKCELVNYARVNKKKIIKPFMLVVCKDRNHAKIIEEYVKSDEFKGGKYRNKTIKIESKMSGVESEFNTRLLLDVERADNPVEIVIHINMLKEGWDVNNLYTIVPLRTAASRILREQMVGRGLRLPYGKRTGDKWIDAVMLTAHDKFNEIIEEAQKGNSIFRKGNIIKTEEMEQEKNTYTQMTIPYPEVDDEFYNTLKVEDINVRGEFAKKITKLVRSNIEDYIFISGETQMKDETRNALKGEITEQLMEEDFGKIFEDNKDPILKWLDININETYKSALDKFILIPRIKTERNQGEYYFKDFDLDLLKFKQKPIDNKILLLNLINSSETELIKGEYINFYVYNPNKVLCQELRNKPEIDYQKTSELLNKLINQVISKYQKEFSTEGMKNIIMMYKREIATEIYNQMIKHFVRNEGIIQENVFLDKVVNYQSSYSYEKIKDLFDLYNSDKDGRITSILFDGIKKGVFSTAKFDSVPELKLARQLERDILVLKWLRPSPSEFNFTYDNGKKYEPDFVAEMQDMVYLIEVKADNQLKVKDVLLKRKVAIDYCNLVSKWAEASGNKRWKHLFIPASKIIASTTIKYLTENYVVE